MFASTISTDLGDTIESHLQGWKNEIKALQLHINHSKIYSAHIQAFFKFTQQAISLETDNALQENPVQRQKKKPKQTKTKQTKHQKQTKSLKEKYN